MAHEPAERDEKYPIGRFALAADPAAYEAKRKGKGRSAVFDPEARGTAPT
jgi:hypothetical protein